MQGSGNGLQGPLELKFHLFCFLTAFMLDIEDCVSWYKDSFALDLYLEPLALFHIDFNAVDRFL